MPTAIGDMLGPPKNLGTRALSRQNTLSKLIATARDLFVELGYEAATVRKIAEVSGLGMGTIFHYISEKRDLIFLIFNDQAEERVHKAMAALQPWQSFRAKVLSVAETHYQLIALDPELGRILLTEIDHASKGKPYLQHLAIRQRQQEAIETLTLEAQAAGEIRRDISAKLIARTFFYIYASSARAWIYDEDPTWRSGMRQLAEVFDVVLKGIEVPATATAGESTSTSG